jgi:hypothetical protein
VKMLSAAVVAAPCLGAFAALAVADDDREPTLLGRAILASDAYQPGPPSGAFAAGVYVRLGRYRASQAPTRRAY